MRAAIIRALGLWALACVIAAIVGATPGWAHGAHHHAPAPTVQSADHGSAAPVVVAVARTAVATCQPAHGTAHHDDGCCSATSCCTAGCGAAVALTDAPALLPAPPVSTPANPGLDRAGRETRPAEHPPRPTV